MIFYLLDCCVRSSFTMAYGVTTQQNPTRQDVYISRTLKQTMARVKDDNGDVEIKALIEGVNNVNEDEDTIPPLVEDVIDVTHTSSTAAPAPPPPTLRLKAPSDLPPNYLLPVLFKEESNVDTNNNGQKYCWKSATVKIPQGGVTKGQSFQVTPVSSTTIHTIRPLTSGRWITSEFELSTCCCSSQIDTDFCLLAWFCNPIAWACLKEQLSILEESDDDNDNINHQPSRHRHSPRFTYKSIGILSGTLLVFHIISFLLNQANREERHYEYHSNGTESMYTLSTWIWIGFIIFAVFVRRQIRARYQIANENCIYDLFCVWMFGPCSVLQAFRHMKHSYEHPNLGYTGQLPPPTKADVVVLMGIV